MSLYVFLRRVLAFLCLPVLVLACAQKYYYENDIELQQKWLPFVEDGTSTKREIEQTLGQPTTRYEDGKIWAYSIQLTEARAGEIGILEPETTGIPEPETTGIPESYVGHYSLVLVFDEKNILKRHSLVRVNP